MPVDYVNTTAPHRNAFQKAFMDLLAFQYMYEHILLPNDKPLLLFFSGIKLHNDSVEHDNAGLYAVQALTRPIAQRFRYHFEGTRETNRLDKVCCRFIRNS